MTHGDEYNVKCPHCRKTNNGILMGRRGPAMGEVVEFEKPCSHCQKPVYYWVRWSVTVDAERPERVE